MTREILPFIKKLEQAGRRRVLITVNSEPRPSIQRVLYQLVHGEAEEVVPGHVELINAIWELGILPDIRVLPVPFTPAPSRDAAIAGAIARFPGKHGFVRFWMHALTSSLPPAPRGSSRVMLHPVEKF
jgi:hypothetical protein